MMKLLTMFIGTLWLCFGLGAAWAMARYVNTPGIGAVNAPASLTPEAFATGTHERARLLLFLHPYCPCSRATLNELDGIIAASGDRAPEVTAFFYQPQGEAAAEFQSSELLDMARKIEGVRVFIDEDGAAARRFDARTSGQVLLYDRSGKLVFKGGITAGRGHEGPNQGAEAIATFIRDGSVPDSSYPVFGCAITDQSTTY